MHLRVLAAAAAALALALATACGPHRGPQPAGGNASPEESARADCRAKFAACAPQANYAPDLDVDKLDVRSLVQIAWRLDLDDRLCERAGKRLRKLAEREDVETVRAIAAAADAASATLGRCKCTEEAFQPQYEKQRVATIVAGRLPPRELAEPSYWAAKIDPHLQALRALSRRSAEALAIGDERGSQDAEAEARKEERALCETVHAARDSLPQGGMVDLQDLLAKGRERESGEASIDAARRALERAERQASCADAAAE